MTAPTFETSPRGAAAARVRAFLDARASMGGPIDHEEVHSVGVRGETYALTTEDLRTLAAPTRADSPQGVEDLAQLEQRLEAKISDAYYDTRNSGGTMTMAAQRAARAVMRILEEVATREGLALAFRRAASTEEPSS